MEWLFDKSKGRTRKLQLFEAVGALGTKAAAKASRGSGGLPKLKCVLEVP